MSKYHFQPQVVSGTGLTTGDIYQGTTVNANEKVTAYTDNFSLTCQ